MIRRIQSSEYLKRYEKMLPSERQVYQDRVGQWLRDGGRRLTNLAGGFDARLQNVMTISVGWNDDACTAFEEGAKLLSACVGMSDTWLPELLYVKAAKRTIKQMVACLTKVTEKRGGEDGLDRTKPYGETKDEGRRTKDEGRKTKDEGQRTRDKGQGTKDKGQRTKDEGGGCGEMKTMVIGVPARPKHIDQYVYLLPAKTQEKAAMVRELLRELDVAREKARLLMGSPQANPSDMAAWAKKATQIDDKVRGIYQELDAEWAKLVESGKVVIDAFGNASVVEEPAAKPQGTVATQGSGETAAYGETKEEERKTKDEERRTKDEGQGTKEGKPEAELQGTVAESVEREETGVEREEMGVEREEKKEELTKEQKARRKELRKWLTDTRRGNGSTRATHVKKWKAAYQEYLLLDNDAAEDEKIAEAAKHYGIEIESEK